MKKQTLSSAQKRASVIMALGVAVLGFQVLDLPIRGTSDYANVVIGIWIISVGYTNWRYREDTVKN